MNTDPRHIALNVLVSWHKGSFTLDKSLDMHAKDMSGLSKSDRSLCNAIIFGVLRKREILDRVIRAFSNTGVHKIDLTSLYIIRITLFQIMCMDKIPAFAAIHTAVDIAKTLSGRKTAGFINAVLRKAAENYATLSLPDKKKDPVKAVSLEHSLPPWLTRKWIKAFGIEKTEALGRQINRIPQITVCCNSLKITRHALLEQLDQVGKNIRITDHAGNGIRFSHPVTSIQELEAFRLGYFHVQDEAAQMVTGLLTPEPGETILDACAGLGGKTFHIAQLMGNKGVVVAVDLAPEKLDILQAESKRLGIDIIRTKSLDLMNTSVKDFDGYFDRVLVDAPCTGLGVLQRNPDTKWKRSRNDIERLAAKQKKMINAASNLVKPGGILVYAVCSCETEENEAVVHSFLNKRRDFSMDTDFESEPYAVLMTHEGFLKTYPDGKDMDGFFAARLKRKL